MRRSFIQGALGLALALMLGGFGSTAAHADPRDFTVINDSDSVIIQLFVAPWNQRDWGEDILPNVLFPGESIDVMFHRFRPGDCFYDILVTYKDGSEDARTEVDLCETGHVVFW